MVQIGKSWVRNTQKLVHFIFNKMQIKLGKELETKRMLSVRECYSMLVVHITCIVVASHGVHMYSPDSQSQAVVMKVFSVGGGVVG